MKGFASLIFALVAVPLVAGIAIAACYDTSRPTPPCSVNAHQEGCPDWPHDMRAPDAGR